MSHQECVGAVSADDSEANGLVLRFRTVPADVNGSEVDDPFTAKQKTFVAQ